MNSKAKVPVLVIEDNPKEAKSILQLLDTASLRSIDYHAETLFEGLDILQNQAISIVLLDLTLPDSNGFRTLTTFIERAPHVPVIVLANTNNEIVGNQSIKAGAQDFLVKGQFDARTLGRSIRYAIQRFSTHIKLQKAASELSVNEKRYVEAQEMAHFGNWEMDIVSNEMRWTEEVYRIMGFQPNSFNPTLSEYLNYVHLEDREKVEDFFEYASKDGKLHQIEHRIINGHHLKHVALRCKINFEEVSNKLVLVGVIQDITGRKLNEKLILEKNFSNRTTKVMQQALSDMSFNVRTPLSSIVNFLYLLKNTSLSAPQNELFNALKVSVDDMSMVLNNLFNFAILANEELKVEVEEFKLKDFLSSNQKALQIRADSGHKGYQFQTSASVPEKISVDPKKLTLVFYNMINYLSQVENKGGQIHVASEVASIAGTSANLSLKFHKEQFKLSLAQIRELQDAEKLLEVYDPNTEDQDNISINIAVILKLSKLLKGKLNIQNTAANSTTFHIEVPIQIVESPSSLGEAGKPHSPLRILLVEDHFLNQIATKRVLKSWSKWISVDIAENGLIAVEKHREHGYDIIVMDIQMPVMDGIEASQKIREQSNVPIVALTANSSKQEQDRCLAVGINDYLSKPFKPTELYDKIMQLMVQVPMRERG